MAKQPVIVGLSGGVDSSVAALLLQEQGYDVSGLFMKNWNDDDDLEGEERYCPAEEDFEDAKSVAAELAIPMHFVNFAKEYWDKVFSYFLEEYKAGRTPNPDILCNKEIKFKVFLDYAIELGAEKIATGHYARVKEEDGEFFLLKGVDQNKDQTYFLYTLGQHQLSHALFPVGELEKPEVRAMAEKYELVTFDKKDSTGICFIGERDFNEFLSRYLPAQAGEMITPDGEVVGQHTGLMYYTLGQRKGLGIGGRKNPDPATVGQPWFVADKNLDDNTLTVVQGKDNPLLYSKALTAKNLHWVSGNPPQAPFNCKAKTRYRQPDQACVIEKIEDDQCYVTFSDPQFGVTPGQSVVFYDGDICLGGGVIETREGIQ